jgi:hypothetical protein
MLNTIKSCPEMIRDLVIYEDYEYQEYTDKYYSTNAIIKELYTSNKKYITFIVDKKNIKIKLNNKDNDNIFELNHSKLHIFYSIKKLCIIIKEKEFKKNIDNYPFYEIKFNKIYKLLNVLYYLQII